MKEHQTTETLERTCGYCGKILHGRTDQRFCNDTCRNNFNRKKRAEERIAMHENMPEIFRIIKKNYEILKSLTKGEPLEWKHTTYAKVVELKQKGFDPQFCTSIRIERDGIWKFCFERGWLMNEAGAYYTIIDSMEQV
jgi:predicted nucleic acid-binding Zn ribbon protein